MKESLKPVGKDFGFSFKSKKFGTEKIADLNLNPDLGMAKRRDGN